MRRKWMFLAPPAFAILIALFVLIGGELVMHLWNWLLPPLFGWKLITFWQAVGLLALCRILFGGVSGRGLHRSNFRRRMSERWQERWMKMTPEEREKFRQTGWRCGFRAPAGETSSTGTSAAEAK
jgi:hypothetical protein